MELIKIYTSTDASKIKYVMEILLENQIECFQKETTTQNSLYSSDTDTNIIQEKSIFVLPSDQERAKELLYSSSKNKVKKQKINNQSIKKEKKKKKPHSFKNKFGFMSYLFIFLFLILPILIIMISVFSSILSV